MLLIHLAGDSSSTDFIAKMVELLEKVISSLPTQDAELFDAHECFPGFLKWNSEWEKLYNSDPMKGKLHFKPLTNLHLYYKKWIEKCESDDSIEFKKLWEIVMIRSTSEAICETIGSIMNQHTGKNRHLSFSAWKSS